MTTKRIGIPGACNNVKYPTEKKASRSNVITEEGKYRNGEEGNKVYIWNFVNNKNLCFFVNPSAGWFTGIDSIRIAQIYLQTYKGLHTFSSVFKVRNSLSIGLNSALPVK